MHSLLMLLAGGEPTTVYLGWGDFTIQLGNFLIIVAMFTLFSLALVLPFPSTGRKQK